MYNITAGTTATKGNELGIFEGVGDVYAQEDLNLFFATLARYVQVLKFEARSPKLMKPSQ